MKRPLPILALLLALLSILFALDTLLKAPRRREALDARRADLLRIGEILASRAPQRDFLAAISAAPDLSALAAAHFPPDSFAVSALPSLPGPADLSLRRQTLSLRRVPYADIPAFLSEASASFRLLSISLDPSPAPAVGDASLTFLSPATPAR